MPEINPNTALASLCGILPVGTSAREIRMPRQKVITKAFTLRLSQDLYEAIERIAETEIRPVNSQMLIFLREGVQRWLAESHLGDTDTTS